MLTQSKSSKGSFEEPDPTSSARFAEAGFGVRDGKLLLLHPLEAGYLLKTGKAEFSGGLEKFLASQKKQDKNFPFALAVYSQIRATGRMVRPYLPSRSLFRVYAPGVGREKERPSQLVCLLPGKTPSAATLAAQVAVAHSARLDLIIACGTEKEIKFHKVSSYNF